MFKVSLAALAVLSVGHPALAQMGPVEWGQTPPSSENALDAQRRGVAAAYAEHRMQQEAAQAQAAADAETARQDRATRVGALMASGECERAKNLALQEGDFDLAARVIDLCKR